MDWHPSVFEPNLKFASELKGDLKIKYFEQHEKAKKALETFSCSLQNVFLKHQKLLNENIELSVTNEKLKKLIYTQESNQQVPAIIERPSSEIFKPSPIRRLPSLSKLSISEKKSNLDDKSSSIVQKENVKNDFPLIYSEDFYSDMEDVSFRTHKSPPVSAANSPGKIQMSPILSKFKKNSSKRSNSFVNTSSQSIDSNNDSKISSANTSSFEKTIDIYHDLNKEFARECENKPLKPIENILRSPFQENQDKSAVYKILNVSKTNCAKTEFLDKGKKSRQAMLSFKKVPPVMDISKVDLDESLGNKSNKSLLKKDYSWSETFHVNSMTNQNSDSILSNMKKLNSPRNSSKESRTSNNRNTCAKEDESAEISPVQNEKFSKLRNKLSFIKKSNFNNVEEKNNQFSNEKLSFSTSNNNNILQKKRSFNNEASDTIYENNINLEANVPQTSISDETYFSQAEMTNHKNDMTNFEIDSTEFEDEDMQCDTPPAKKMLLNSFDVIPGRAEESLGYAYKEGPVRKKREREKLEGWDCRECEQYYRNMPEEDRKHRQNFCSRHRGKYKPDNPETPPSFWNPVFSDSEEDSSMFND